LDSTGNLKISDFGLSALPQQVREDGLLHTTCGTPNYVAPEVLNDKGYDGAVADIWSCGVILYVLMAGFLPFNETDLLTLYRKIQLAEFSYPFWFSSGAKALISKILNPRPNMVSDLDVTCTLMVVTKFQLFPQFSDSRNPSESEPSLDPRL
jgi:serine/threonine protein kinase